MLETMVGPGEVAFIGGVGAKDDKFPAVGDGIVSLEGGRVVPFWIDGTNDIFAAAGDGLEVTLSASTGVGGIDDTFPAEGGIDDTFPVEGRRVVTFWMVGTNEMLADI